MCDAVSRRIEHLLERLGEQMTRAEAQLGRALELENRSLASIEARLRLIEARDAGDEDGGRIELDDLDLRVTLLYDQIGRLSAQVAILTGSVGLPQDSEPCSFDPPIDRDGHAAD
jgi:hypothetical protein